MTMLLMGFLAFAASATRHTPRPLIAADAIVVLTGGTDRRIEAGLKLLRGGLGKRMLITGVNRKIKAEDFLAPSEGSARCCIDLGYDAMDTIGNAAETRRWAEALHYKRLIVVTSSYHMQRSLTELALAMPEVELIAHPVLPRIFSDGPWWLRPSAARLLVAEYLKLIQSYARYAAHRLLEPIRSASLRSHLRYARG